MAIHLLPRARGGDRIYLFEQAPPFARGVAYGTDDPLHLLNVGAAGLGALEDHPRGFLDWLNSPASGDLGGLRRPLAADAFVSRMLYGRYLQHCLHEVLSSARRGRHFRPVTDEVVDIEELGSGLTVRVRDGRSFAVDSAVVATGNRPPDDVALPCYVGNPWNPGATLGIDPSADVLLIGTGLTMVDVVLSLVGQGHEGRIHAVSRRGLLPRTQAPESALPAWRIATPLPPTALGLLQAVRAEVAVAAAHGRPWQDVVQALRPRSQALWQSLDAQERRRFLRHLRPWWEVHRHRLAPSVSAHLDRLLKSGQLSVRAGRIDEQLLEGDRLVVRVRARGSRTVEELSVARVINCSGPRTDCADPGSPLLRALLARGLARPDGHGLGLEVDQGCALLDRHGEPSERLFALGPVTRGTFWEITAVPEIRRRCATLAADLMRASAAEPAARPRLAVGL
ncbi:FAD/NAD(P)-binding protein [Tistlia consotensis]|nr:FAD/NAD(P)-binding protein [Tistlia consotensis]